MIRRIGTLCLLVLLASVTAAWASPAATIEPPVGAILFGQSELNELRVFPEMAATTEGRAVASARPLVGTRAIDAVYQSPSRYEDTVRFFDEQFAKKKVRVLARTVTETSTSWTVERGDATTANIIVRATAPHITVEIAQAADLPR
jgi:hypothetical protein